MLFDTNKQKGNAGLVMGIAYFGANGYCVNLPLNDTQWYDFVAEKEGRFYTVQCKATGSNDNRIDFRSTGGTNGKVYDYALDYPLDYIFCLDGEQNMYCIPAQDIPKDKKGIVLRTEPNNNGQGFNTYLYHVKI